MSEEQVIQAEATEQTAEPQELTEGERIARAANLLAQQEQDRINETQEIDPNREPEKEPDVAPVVEPATDDRSEYYAKLVEKDREIRQLKEQLKGPDFRKMAQEDPKSVLQELGLSPSQLLDMWVGDEEQESQAEPTQEDVYKTQIEELRNELKALKDEQEQATFQEQINSRLKFLDETVKKDTDRWELINVLKDEGALQLVLETEAETWKLTSEYPDTEAVLDAVEQHLFEEYGNRYKQLSAINKLSHKHGLNEKQQEEPKKQEEVDKQMSKSPLPAPTLGATNNAETPIPRSLNEQERFSRALSKLEDIDMG